ncbi:MAG: cell surface protein [Comamonas sp.]
MIGGVGFMGAASAGNVISNAGAATPAATLSVTSDGVGHILLVPYFSTQNGNVSLLNITNTDQKNGKAVKLRYRGAANSDDVYDITLLLSPGDMWSANVSQDGGVSFLTTNDNSCTLPAAVNAPFSTVRVRGEDPKETLEGYIEILNTADIPKFLANADGSASTVANPLYNAIKHDSTGTPKCGTIASQTADVTAMVGVPDGTTDAANDRGYSYPTGGLMANWSIVNLAKSGSFTGAATAIVAGTLAAPKVPAQANIVFSPQDDADQDTVLMAISALTADPLLAGGVDGATPPNAVAATIAAKNYDFPDLSTPYTNGITPLQQAEALSGSLATLSVTNEYMTSPDVGFATDWTFSMPSRRYNVALDYVKPQAVYTSGGTYFTAANAKLNTAKTQICVPASYADLQYYDTSEQGKAAGGYVISPQPAGANLAFCGETSVLGFNQGTFAADTATSVLGALIARQSINTVKAAKTSEAYTDGWMTIATNGNGGIGLPILGHAFAKALSSTANLGGIWAHRTDLVNK